MWDDTRAETEVGQLDIAVYIEQDILKLDVPVYVSFLMDMENGQNLDRIICMSGSWETRKGKLTN